MARKGAQHRCTECGYEVAKWVGRCPECQAWGTITEQAAPAAATAKVAAGAPSSPARPIGEVDLDAARARSTGVAELDRVLGGGLVPGAVMLLAGEPGVGKSTLLLEVAYRWVAGAAGSTRPSLYITGEESAGQVRLRAERTGNLHESMYLAAESDFSALLGHVDAIDPGLLIVDSVQTMSSPKVDGTPGGVAQVKDVTAGLVALAKERGLPVVLVGHVTKEGSVAGPRVLEHVVDVVLHFEGERHSTLRMVRGVKNRFGAADEVGCFELRDEGIVGISDPSGLFLNPREQSVPGTAITVTIEGKRPLLAEVQSLMTQSALTHPRRAVSGLDSARVSMVLAVLEGRARKAVGSKDVYAATVGGMTVVEPAADLAIALAMMSAHSDRPVPRGLVAVGEVGLAGEVRPVRGVGRRLVEAARMGYTRALVPAGSEPAPEGIRAVEVAELADALEYVGRPDLSVV
ncbi:DNA repair protein RadA [Haloechinothrix sp. YIM 98757]|uniref:DNA repair protein RadA n=1 Tax=Haloechinothrix aidingensis TaxID=2752311 RepID=A0A838AF50_9PSEU|nr:DNA repair protein RadA [Haloechinothrix aidingensis]